MVQISYMTLYNRQHAAHLFSEKLLRYKNSDAIVVGISHGGGAIGFALSGELNLIFELILYREIRHPANPSQKIGSVSSGLVLIDNTSYDLPQDFLVRQISKLRYEINNEYQCLFGERRHPALNNKTIILVADLLDTGSQIMNVVNFINSHQPSKLIVLAPVVSPADATALASVSDELIFLSTESQPVMGKDFSDRFPPLELSDIKELCLQHELTSN